jgi:hypothetical protein
MIYWSSSHVKGLVTVSTGRLRALGSMPEAPDVRGEGGGAGLGTAASHRAH